MRDAITLLLLASFSMLGLAACGERATLPVQAGIGPQPTLPSPNPTLIPTVNIAPAKGWPAGTTPTAAAGLAVSAFATGLDHPHWLYVLPNGDVLVTETNAPPNEHFVAGDDITADRSGARTFSRRGEVAAGVRSGFWKTGARNPRA